MWSRVVALFFLLSPWMFGQSIDAHKVATVHVYRQGRLLISVPILVDGSRVVALDPHESPTFYLLPGYHVLTLPSGEIAPTASFKAVVGKEYFFQLSYEHVVTPTSVRALSVSLTMEPGIKGADVREVKIDPGDLLAILAQSNPDGLQPKDPILAAANASALPPAVGRR